jgi:hypothetical protein
MQVRHVAFKRGRAEDWTKERIEQLDKQGIQQLQANAQRLGEAALAELCSDVLKARPRTGAKPKGVAAKPAAKRRHLTSRNKAFEGRGVTLQDARSSWSGVRESDGTVVMTIWEGAVESTDGSCSYLLWAPNREGSRPWSDKPAGKERLEHCKLAVARGGAEGLLVYGERLEGHIPEDKARSVQGVDPETVLLFKVEERGDEYWATWGKKTA